MKTTKKEKRVMAFLLLLLSITVGYALLSQTLEINGTSKIKKTTWKVIWDNVVVNENSVSGDAVTSAAEITNTEKTLVEYSITLSKPGDFYEFTVDAKNEGTIDAMINVLSNKVYESNGTTEKELPEYLDYSITYSDGIEISKNHLLKSGFTETYKVRVEFADVTADKLPSEEETLKFKFSVDYVQADDNAIQVDNTTSFSIDSWETIALAVKRGTTSNYNVGDTKTVDMGSLGTHTLRIANKSTPAECSTTGFSQTACGFVIEFADIITTHRMNPYDSSVTISGNGNKGGWPASEMRTYVNNDIYNALPSELKSVIINTKVVSGHGLSDSTNFTSTDKLYLLSPHEVFEDVDGNTGDGIDYRDSAYKNTRQFDYYKNAGVTTSNYSSVVIKQYNGSNKEWWLCAPNCAWNYGNFFFTYSNGNWGTISATNNYGVSPAFRLG